jgi:predicted Zn-dependent protease
MALSTLATPLRAANQPRAGKAEKATVLWTNEDLEKLSPLGVISIVGQPNTREDSTAAALPPLYVQTPDPEWYAEQAARLRDELERRKAQLDGYRQAIEDARSLKTTTGGINLDDGDIAITPEAGIEILQRRVSETESDLDALEDLARHNDIPPGVLRGQ